MAKILSEFPERAKKQTDDEPEATEREKVRRKWIKELRRGMKQFNYNSTGIPDLDREILQTEEQN